MIWSVWLCGLLLVLAFTTDIRSWKIPNKLTISVTIIAWLGHGVINSWKGLAFSLLGTVSGFGIMFVLFLFRAVGAGDVKLFSAIGSCMGISFTYYTFIYAIVYGGIISAGILLYRRVGDWRKFGYVCKRILWLRTMTPLILSREKQTSFPFMWAVLPAAVSAYWSEI